MVGRPHYDNAFPHPDTDPEGDVFSHSGLTIRELVALHIYTDMVCRVVAKADGGPILKETEIAIASSVFGAADAFCDELKKQREAGR